MPIDLKQYQIAETAVDLVILDPVDNTPTDVVLKVISPEAATIRQRSIQIARKIAESKDLEDRVENSVNALCALIVDWSGLQENGQDLKFTPANVKRILTDHIWLREQVDRFCGDRTHFFVGSDRGDAAADGMALRHGKGATERGKKN